jgi:CRISPR-associated endonuclease/helicase Cas3
MDVAAVVRALVLIPTIRRRLDRLADRTLSDVDIERLVALGFLHDLGKASAGFQSKALHEGDRHRLIRACGGEVSECGHTSVLGPLFFDRKLRSHFFLRFPIQQIQEWDSAFALLLAAVSHHGTPIRLCDLEANASLMKWSWNSLGNYDPWATVTAMGDTIQALFRTAFEPVREPLPALPAFVHAFAGLVSLADWIASNPHPGFFPYELADERSRWERANDRAVDVLRKMRIDVESIRSDLRSRAVGFSGVFQDDRTGAQFEPTELQSKMAALDLGPTVIVEAETGSGKTEAALWRFKTLFEAGEVDALAFVLPTRVSAVQIYARVQRFIVALFPNPVHRPNVLLAVPGYLRVDDVDALDRLTSFDVLWPDDSNDAQAHLRWVAENTKRYLAAGCAVGTVDQVLLSGLQVRHAHLRGFALLRSLLVVDEVHASDLYMTHVLRGVIERHQASGGHALMLSATLGVAARTQLLAAGECNSSVIDAKSREQAAYPCISDRFVSHPIRSGGRAKTVEVELKPWLDDVESIADRVTNAVANGGRVLVVRNTVSGVLAAQQALENHLSLEHAALFRCNSVVCPHHGRYAAADRVLLDGAIERAFGKAASSRPAVLCGSQTLEQSLDIDADLLITDLAPMDVLLQRIGRLHRHAQRQRPPSFENARVVVMVPDTDDLDQFLHAGRDRHGLGSFVYPNLLSVAATWEELAKHPRIEIPLDNRALVERCTDPNTLKQLADSGGERWLHHWQNQEGVARSHAQAAHYATLDWTAEWEEVTFPSKEERIRTRLGTEAVRVPLMKPAVSPFGQVLTELAIPAWMWRGTGSIGPSEVSVIDRRLIMNIDGQRFSYSRLGLERVVS